MDGDEVLQSARAAVAAHAWEEAFEGFSAVDAGGELSPEDLDDLSEAAFWAGHAAEAVDARQRAFAAYEREGREGEAARAAVMTTLLHFGRGDSSMAGGWLGRAQRLLADMPESPAHALLAWTEGQMIGHLKGFDEALEKAREVEAIGRRVGDRDLIAMGACMQGFVQSRMGDAEAGRPLMDEALAAALSGELGPFASAEVFCEMVLSCIETADFQRAAEWLDTADRAGRELVSFPGCCHVHRATVLRQHGDWPEAQLHARQARDEVAGIEVMHEGMAWTELGELHRCKGAMALAEQDFSEAYEKGWPPQPGLALLRLRTGDIDGAMQIIGRAVDSSADEPPALVRLLPAQVEIAAAAGDDSVIDAACARLAEVASALGSTTAAAATASVVGLREQRRGNLAEAARQFESSVRAWQQVRSPYETAQARMHLAGVLTELGEPASARLELAAARKTFEQLGATPDAREAARRLGDDAPTSVTRAFMFTDIVNSTSVLSALGDEAWDGVRRWHDRTVTTIIAEHDGTVVKTLGDGFFATFDEPALAVDGAIAIQRALDEHRRREGFSPVVRIGVHAGSALSAEDDYSGQEVNVAARISALAEADEILVSAAVADRCGGHVAIAPRGPTVLKGIPTPVDIAAVDWR